MEISINQKKISFKDKYLIDIDGIPSYYAASRLFRFLSEIELFKNDAPAPQLVIKRQFSFFKVSYDITLAKGDVLELRTVSIWRLHYQVLTGADCYDIYGHKGRKYSVFKNDIQIAWWDKNALTVFKGDKYKIVVERASDYELIIAFCLALDNYRTNKNDDKAIKFDWNLGFNKRKFDEGWYPKS